jgi:hypothetical protein
MRYLYLSLFVAYKLLEIPLSRVRLAEPVDADANTPSCECSFASRIPWCLGLVGLLVTRRQTEGPF